MKTINQIQGDYGFQLIELVKWDVIGISLNSTKLINVNNVSMT